MRYLFPGDAVWLPPDADDISKIAANTPFTWWDDLTAGAEITDVTAPDAVSVVELTTDADGLRPHMRGPDGNKGPMFIDIGAAIRYPVYSSEALAELLAAGFGSTELAALSDRITAVETSGPIAAVDESKMVAIGDSLTDADPSDNWPEMFQTITGITAQNFGRAGWASTDIAVYFGAVNPALTLVGNSIPGTGAVNVAAIVPATQYRNDGSGPLTWSGTLVGVPGTLRHAPTPAELWTFTRTTPGEAVACPPGSVFHDPSADACHTGNYVVWAGRNNGGNMDPAIRDTDMIVATQKAAFKRALVLGVINATSEGRNSFMWTAITRYNRLAAIRYPNFFDIRAWLISHGLQVAGITPTGTDRADIANDTIPTSLRNPGDSLHFSTSCKLVIAAVVTQYFAVRGWVAGLIPVEVPGQATGLALGTATSTNQPLTWSAVTGATTYMVEYRTATNGVWTFAAAGITASASVANLSPGTAYDYRVTAYNVAGPGLVSVVVTGSTPGSAAVVLGSDSFNRADTLQLVGSTDSAYGGTTKTWVNGGSNQIGILANQAYRSGLTSSRELTFDAGVTNGQIRFKVGTLPTNSALTVCLLGRRTDLNNCYRVDFTGAGGISFKRVSGGVVTGLGSTGIVASGDVLGLSCVGTTITVYQNGAAILTATDSGITAGNTWGALLSADAGIRLDDMQFLDK